MPRRTHRSSSIVSQTAPSRTGRRPSAPHRKQLAIALVLTLAPLLASTACSVRTVEDQLISRYGIQVDLRSDKKPFSAAVDHGYAQPSQISVERLVIILGSLEIERREGARTVRGPAIPAEIVSPIAQALAESFREADSSQRIALSAERKQMQKAIFNRKFLTTLVTWMEGEDLVVHLSRSDWPIDEKRKSGLPRPHVDDPQQKFRMVTNEFVRRAGRTGVAVTWRDEIFSTFAGARAVRTAPAAASAPRPEAGDASKTVLMDSGPEALPEPEPLTNAQLQNLDASELRELADLEEARDAGRVTEDAYRRDRKALLDAATTD